MNSIANGVIGIIIVIIGVAASIFGLFFLCFGAYGLFVALFGSNGGFVGEGGFYASALLYLSVAMIVVGPVLGLIAFLCFTRCSRFLQSS